MRTLLRAPWTSRSWLAAGHLLMGPVVGMVPAVLILALAVATPVLLVVPPLGAGALAVLVTAIRAATAMQRSRFASFLGVAIPPPAGGRTGTWRQAAYHLLSPWLTGIGALVVVASWSIGIAFGTAFLHGWPDRGLSGLDLRSPATLAVLTVLGLAAFFAAPWLTLAVAAVDSMAARSLLGPSRREQLARRVELLATSRAGVVDATDAERRRIERDLHDGTQQRLTSLAMNLGMARETMTDLPEPARATIASAHEQAIQALADLRDVVRGLHPAVLDDRGLDAALSGIAARAPLPVRVRVDLPRRPPGAIEAVAYFVVSEALTNVAKHAQASQAQVRVESVVNRNGNRLRVSITDDGRGGADPAGGTGLRGLSQRVAAADGTLHIDSPPGGPTAITAELPCGS